MTSGDLDIIKAGLIDRIGEVCERLLPEGRLESGQWVSWNPVTNDKSKTPALKIRARGGDLGAWRDYRSGDKGDVLKLVAYIVCRNPDDTKGALAWGRDFLGIQSMSRADHERMRKAAAERAVQRDRQNEKRRHDKLLAADRLFNAEPGEREIGPAYVPHGAFAFGQNTPAELHARAYFAARKVPLDEVAGRYAFRFSPATEWWKGARWENQGQRKIKVERGALYPAVHSAMRNFMGLVTACHVTFLDPIRPAKAPVTPAKLMFGEALGSVIELSRGPSGKAFWMTADDTPACPLIVAEGIETALSFAVEVAGEARVWACGSLAGVGGAASLIQRLDCIAWVLFARDNNTGNPQAQRQFASALESLESTGKRVVVEASHVGDDFNDLARGEE